LLFAHPPRAWRQNQGTAILLAVIPSAFALALFASAFATFALALGVGVYFDNTIAFVLALAIFANTLAFAHAIAVLRR
jgi:hypothetical protein